MIHRIVFPFLPQGVAIWLCVGTWVYVHVFLLPGLVNDDLFYRANDGTCQVNNTAQRGWALTTQIVVYNSAVIVTGVSYPVIWWKIRQRKKVRPGSNGRNLQKQASLGSSGHNSKSSCPPEERRGGLSVGKLI